MATTSLLRPFLATALAAGTAWAQPLTIYTEIDPPSQSRAQDGSLTGMSVEVVKEIQRRVGNHDSISVVPWARSYNALQTLPRVVLFATARTAERDPQFQWVGPIDERRYFLYVKSSSTVSLHSLDDARKLGSIGVYKDDVRDLYLTGQGFANLDRTVDNIQNVKKLMSGRIDAFAYASVGLEDLARSAGYKAADLKPALPLLNVQLYIAFSKATPETIVERWSQALAAMKKDRTFERIFHTYYPDQKLPGPAITRF